MINPPNINWWAIAPELVLAAGCMIVLLAGIGSGARSRTAAIWLTLATLVAAAGVTIGHFNTSYLGALQQQIDVDRLTNLGRLLAIGGAMAAVLLSWRARADDHRHGEHHALILAATCGMGLFAASGSLVTMFVGLELFSIALYVLCALEAERVTSLEAGLKYLIVGGMSSAVLLYGSALLYGATGSMTLTEIGAFGTRGMLLHVGAIMLLAGLVFKASAAPLHWWTPDVYDGAPTPVTTFMAIATKGAAFVVLARVIVVCFHQDSAVWEPIIAAIAATSIIVGNLGALVQQRLKRMLAYSSIAHAGYLLVAFTAADKLGLSALIYALVVYATMTLGAFALVMLWERHLDRPVTFDDLRGRGWAPVPGAAWLAGLPSIALVIVMLSLAGIPPTAGFFAKFAVFGAAVENGYAWLALIGALGSVVSLGYYLRVPVALYLQQPLDDASSNEDGAFTVAGDRMLLALLGTISAAAIITIGFVPGPLYDASCDVRNDVFKQIDTFDVGCASLPAPADATGS